MDKKKLRRSVILTGLGGLLLGVMSCKGDGDKDKRGQFSVTSDALYVVNGASHNLSVLDAGSGIVTATVPLEDAQYPHHISLSPDGTKLAVAVPGIDLSAGHGGGHGAHAAKGKLILLDAQNGKVIQSRELDATNHNAIFSPDGLEIWTALMTTPGSVWVLDAASLEKRQVISVGDMPAEVTFSQDGKRAFVANGGSDTVSVINVSAKTVEQTLTVGDGPVGAWPGSNNVMYVDNEAGQTVTAIDAKSLAKVRTYNLGFTPAMVATGPNDELWVTDTDNGKVVIMTTNSAQQIAEIPTGEGAHGIVFSADGKTGYVTNQGAGSVSLIDVASKKVRTTVAVGDKPNGLLFRKQ